MSSIGFSGLRRPRYDPSRSIIAFGAVFVQQCSKSGYMGDNHGLDYFPLCQEAFSRPFASCHGLTYVHQ
jgi:predicted nucleic acid binding AN1-type Zn finger protein